MTASTSLPYVEPNIITILILSSFLLLANMLDHILNRLLFCGLIGHVLLGIAWGTPGCKLLSEGAEAAIVQFGYLGLILIVYEGGLSTSLTALKANIFLSVCVALTGISLPIALSFILIFLADATYLQAFAAGAALCSTSLGTTFTVLDASGLIGTRLGVVLTSAALMDDVVGLVMVQVVSSLGGAKDSVTAAVILRPVLVSLAFAICVPLACRLVLSPIIKFVNRMREAKPCGTVNKTLSRTECALALHTILLLALITTATYAGTSNLFASYLAGAIISWWDTEVPHTDPCSSQAMATSSPDAPSSAETIMIGTNEHTVERSTSEQESKQIISHEYQGSTPRSLGNKTSGAAIYKCYYKEIAQRVLKPFFFASIGFSIPISKMFMGAVIWKGLVYATLMSIGKLACGIWLVRTAVSPATSLKILSKYLRRKVFSTKVSKKRGKRCQNANGVSTIQPAAKHNTPQSTQGAHSQVTSRFPRKPISLYPPAILSFAMIARGEIGFLISALAQSSRIFDAGSSRGSTFPDSEIFLVVTWAIVLCTFTGPLCVGILVRRVKQLEKKRSLGDSRSPEGQRDVLGVWGVEQPNC